MIYFNEPSYQWLDRP